MSLSITLPVMPEFRSFSVDGYTPVSTPVVPESGASTSGCTILRRLPNTEGLPKKMNVEPGTSRLCIHFTPLKNTISISPLSSATRTLRRLTALYLSLSAGSSAPFLANSRTFCTVARTCTWARSGCTSAMRTMLLRSM